MFRKLKQLLERNDFIRNVLVLVAGFGLAQLIPLALSPVISRLFVPETFGGFAVLMATVTTLVPIVSLRYEYAQISADTDEEADELFYISSGLVFLSSLAFGALLFLARDLVFGEEKFTTGFLLFLPAIIFVYGLMNVQISCCNRKYRYHDISSAKLIQNATMLVVQIVIGFFLATELGLLLGVFLGVTCSLGFLAYRNKFRFNRLYDSFQSKRRIAKKYFQYPLMDGPPTLLNTLTTNIPYFFLPLTYSAAEVGFYFFVQRTVYAPLAIVASSISKVNQRKSTELIQADKSIFKHTVLTTCFLAVFAAMPMALLFFMGEDIFVLVFGKDWATSGKFAEILAFSFVVQFLGSAMSSTMLATKDLGYGALWKSLAFAVMLAVYWYFPSKSGIVDMLVIHAWTISGLYALYLFLSIFSSSKT